MRLIVVVFCFAIVFSLLPIIGAQPNSLWSYEKYNGYIRLPTFSVPNAQVTYENTTEGFEFNITLSKKPAGSSFKINIESGGWNWYYQPPLDQELNITEYSFVNATHAMNGTDVLVYRAENVVGSYAVYARVSGGDYGTGKVFHLYRPLLIDRNGAWSWGSVNVSGGVLTVSADASWLNGAVYPVVVDPTFGYTSAGGSSMGVYMTSTVYKWVACKFTSPSGTNTISKLTAYVYVESSTGEGYAAVFSDSAGTPNALLENGDTHGDIPQDSYAWVDFNINYGLSASTVYWLSVGAHDIGAGHNFWIAYDAGDTGQAARTGSDTYPPYDPYNLDSQFDRILSIYATYEATGGNTYTLTLGISSPSNITYDETIPVSLSATGNDTNPDYSWNIQFTNSSWLYGSNQTSTTYTIEIFENQTNCLFACALTGDNENDYGEVYFSVVYVPADAWDADVNNYFSISILLVLAFVFMGFMFLRRGE